MSNDMEDALWRDIETELEKSADFIDPDYIDRRINELCELEARRSGARPPESTEARINAVIARISAGARKKTPARRLHPLIRLAAVACILVFFFFALFAINYVYARVTDNCFLIGAKESLCCGTDYCPCTIPEKKNI